MANLNFKFGNMVVILGAIFKNVGVTSSNLTMAPRRLGNPDRIVLEAPPPDSPPFQALTYLPCPDPEQEGSAGFLVPSPQKKTRRFQPSLKKKGTYSATSISRQCLTIGDNYADFDGWESVIPPDGDIVDLDRYQEYVHAVTSDIAGLYMIEKTVFVAQGWDFKAMSTTVCTMSHSSITR